MPRCGTFLRKGRGGVDGRALRGAAELGWQRGSARIRSIKLPHALEARRRETLAETTRQALGEALQEFVAIRGALRPGQRADFIIVDRDPLEAAPAALRETRVLETWVGARKVFSRPRS